MRASFFTFPFGEGGPFMVDEVKSLPCVKGGAEQSEAEGARVSLFIYRRLFRTLNSTQAPSVTFGATSLSEGGSDNPSVAPRQLPLHKGACPLTATRSSPKGRA